MYVEYNSNNSGGSWWLKDEHWKALEAAGWKVQWASLENLSTEDGKDYVREVDGTPKLVPLGQGNSRFGFLAREDADGEYRWLGALAKNAFRVGVPMRDAAEEWERITGLYSTDAGCACCGQPHRFTEYDDAGKYVCSGPSASYEAHW